MVFICLSIYFAVICVGVGLAFLPDSRDRLARSIRAIHIRTSARADARVMCLRETTNLSASTPIATLAAASNALRSHPTLFGACVTLVAAPPAIAVLIHKPTIFSLDDHVPMRDQQVEILLRGEQLVPPPPLPPEVFMTQEVETVRPDLTGASRDWTQLAPEFTQRLLLVFQQMREQYGYEMTLLEGYRSPERQTALAAQGSHVTQVRAYMSYHQHGLAADSAFIRDGRVVISERDPWAMRGYELYGKLAEANGLTWGGRWTLRDFGHVELARRQVLGKP